MTSTDTSMDDARALDGPFYIGGTKFVSRLIVGTGKYESNQIMVDAIRASGAEMVTVAVLGELFSEISRRSRLVTRRPKRGCGC